jgi:hypothetical protein
VGASHREYPCSRQSIGCSLLQDETQDGTDNLGIIDFQFFQFLFIHTFLRLLGQQVFGIDTLLLKNLLFQFPNLILRDIALGLLGPLVVGL